MIGYISANAVVERFTSSPIAGMPNQTEGKIVERIWDALDYIKAQDLYEFTTVKLDVVEGSAKLPKHIRTVEEVRELGGSLLSPSKVRIDNYQIHSGRIYVDEDIATLEVTVKALKVDEFGMPLIPDYTEFINAVDYFLRWKACEDGMNVRLVDPGLVEYYKRECAKNINAARMVQRSYTKDGGRRMKQILNRPYLTHSDE